MPVLLILNNTFSITTYRKNSTFKITNPTTPHLYILAKRAAIKHNEPAGAPWNYFFFNSKTFRLHFTTNNHLKCVNTKTTKIYVKI